LKEFHKKKPKLAEKSFDKLASGKEKPHLPSYNYLF